jgi:hypothetical protein
MGNCQSSAWTQLLTCCRRCRTYSVDGPERNPGTNLPLAEREPATQPEGPPVDAQPPSDETNSPENLPEPEALTSEMMRLPKPLTWRNSLSKLSLHFLCIIIIFYFIVISLRF